MNIIIDAMGGDNAPDAAVQGALLAGKETPHKIVLVGNKEIINECIVKYAKGGDVLPFVAGASEVITNDDYPTHAVKEKKDSSINIGLNILKDNMGSVFVSAGNTGAILVASLLMLGRIKGIDRPAICSVYPIPGKAPSFLVDAGANAECKPRNLYEFALMGSVYLEKVLGRKNPTVGLVNIGTEAKKGTTLQQKAYKLLEDSDLNFLGNIEAREIPKGVCDIIVADGFTGNVILKLTEGMGELMARMLAGKGAVSGMSAAFDYSTYGGAPILGVNKPVIKMHGSSNELAVKNAILKACDFAESGVVDIIRENIGK